MKMMSPLDMLWAPSVAPASIETSSSFHSENPGLFAGLLGEELDRLEVLPAQDSAPAVDELIASVTVLVQGITQEDVKNQGYEHLVPKLEEGIKQVQTLQKELAMAQVRVDYPGKLGAIKDLLGTIKGLKEEIINHFNSFSVGRERGQNKENQTYESLPGGSRILGLILEELSVLEKKMEIKDLRLLVPDRLTLHSWQARSLTSIYPSEMLPQHKFSVLQVENDTSRLQRTDLNPFVTEAFKSAIPAEVRENRQVVPIQFLASEMESIMTRAAVVRSTPHVQEMILQLKPESLGKLDVKLQSINGQLTATFIVETAMAKQAVEDQLLQLRHSLQLQGVSVSNLEVIESSMQNSNVSFFQQQKQQPQEQRTYLNRGKKNKEYIDPDDDITNVQPKRSFLGQSGINYTV